MKKLPVFLNLVCLRFHPVSLRLIPLFLGSSHFISSMAHTDTCTHLLPSFLIHPLVKEGGKKIFNTNSAFLVHCLRLFLLYKVNIPLRVKISVQSNFSFLY